MNSEQIDDKKPSTPKNDEDKISTIKNGTIEDMIKYETRQLTNNIVEID